ncbi:MAG: nitroreductase family deazaflavin-dependent oxidoreductase, partial [Dehalococcoidia bacterium]|nr:nitroreductase family deazaflavin-dependent oxidoreductase [Dehalococcoidia bacterium]
MPEELRRILDSSFVLRTTMTRRRSGGLRTVETTYTWDGVDRIYLSGYPGPRDWVASMGANPSVLVTTVEGD